MRARLQAQLTRRRRLLGSEMAAMRLRTAVSQNKAEPECLLGLPSVLLTPLAGGDIRFTIGTWLAIRRPELPAPDESAGGAVGARGRKRVSSARRASHEVYAAGRRAGRRRRVVVATTTGAARGATSPASRRRRHGDVIITTGAAGPGGRLAGLVAASSSSSGTRKDPVEERPRSRLNSSLDVCRDLALLSRPQAAGLAELYCNSACFPHPRISMLSTCWRFYYENTLSRARC